MYPHFQTKIPTNVPTRKRGLCWTLLDESKRKPQQLLGFQPITRISLNSNGREVAERQGFEPWIPCGIHAFQACAFSHSAISPVCDRPFESNTGRPATLN